MARSLKDNLISFWPQPTTSPTNQSGYSQDLISPDELDEYNQYTVQNPSISINALGTYAGTGAANSGIAPLSLRCDYPRNLLLTVSGGTVGGTLTVKGQDQFGGTNTETIGAGTYLTGTAGTLTTNGSTIFATIGTLIWNATNNNTGTVAVGYHSGTAGGVAGTGNAVGTPKFGLPQRIGGSADIKFINYINNGTINVLPSGTGAASTLAGTQFHSFSGTSAVAITDTYNVLFKPTKTNYGTSKQTGLGTT